MERQYIWFHTGVAFVVLMVGIVLSLVVTIAVLFHAPSNPWVQFPLVFGVFAIGVWPAFVVEHRTLSQRFSRKDLTERLRDTSE